MVGVLGEMAEPSGDFDVNDYMSIIENSQQHWAFADNYGSLFTRYFELIQKMHNVASRRNVSIANIAGFYANIRRELNTGNYVHVSVGRDAKVRFYYCHRPVCRIYSNGQILLFGKAHFARGLFHSICYDTVPIPPKSHIYLNGRSYKIRIRAESHLIYIQGDDLICNTFTVFPQVLGERLLQLEIEAAEANKKLINNDEENDDNDDHYTDEQIQSEEGV